SEGPAGVDDLLATALHLRVVALNRAEIQVLLGGAGGHGRRGAAAEPDEHGRAPEHHDGRALGEPFLLHVLAADVAEAARDHDGLVIAADFSAPGARHGDLQRAEVAGDAGTPELVVEGGAAE